MMLFKRIVVCFLALLMFGTSACLAIDTHYCGDEAQSWSLFSKAESCEMMAKRLKEENQELPLCCQGLEDKVKNDSKSKTELSKKPCCYNESLFFKKDVNDDGQSPVFFINNVDYDFPETIEIIESKTTIKYRPFLGLHTPPDPHLDRDIHILHQVFII